MKLTNGQIWLGMAVLAFCTAMQLNTLYQTIKCKQAITVSIEANATEIPVPIIIIDENRTDIKQEDNNKSFEYFKENYASHLDDKEAKDIFESIVTASNKYETDYRIIIPLLYSESRFKAVKHKHNKVIGMGGIHSGIWTKELKAQGIIDNANDLNDTEKNIEATVYIFKVYYDLNNSNVLKALHAYKGRGYDKNSHSYGLNLAKKVYNNYLQIASNI